MIRLLLSLIVLTTSVAAQNCPKETDGPKSPSTFAKLHGQLIFHDNLRQWFELKLDKPHCGQASIEMIRIDKSWSPIQTARGCSVTTSGEVALAFTGYYSLDLYQVVDTIRPAADAPSRHGKPTQATTSRAASSSTGIAAKASSSMRSRATAKRIPATLTNRDRVPIWPPTIPRVQPLEASKISSSPTPVCARDSRSRIQS